MIGTLTKLGLLAAFLLSHPQRVDTPPPVRFRVEKDKSIVVTVPGVPRAEVEQLMEAFFFKDQHDEQGVIAFRQTLQQSPQLTFIITSKAGQ